MVYSAPCSSSLGLGILLICRSIFVMSVTQEWPNDGGVQEFAPQVDRNMVQQGGHPDLYFLHLSFTVPK